MRLEEAERKVLQAIHDLQGDSPDSVEDVPIAAAAGMEVPGVRDVLETLWKKGLIQLDRTGQGYRASLAADGRRALGLSTTRSTPDREQPRETDVDLLESMPGPRLYTVWYGTNRRPNDPADPAGGFSADRDDRVHYGTCQVAIPRSHLFGSVGSSWWRRWLRWTDDRLRVARQDGMDPDAFWQALAASMQEQDDDQRQGLVFLHGYNVGFEEAAIRGAQIGFDLKVPGETAFFSWPSSGTLGGYLADGASVEASEQQIATFLSDFVSRSGARRVHLVAHSMGNRGLLRALQRLAGAIPQQPQVQFGQIILAAPDIDWDVFVGLAELYQRFGRRTTLYASPADRAVGMSRWLYGSPRVGLTPPVTVVPGVDTVEVPRFNVFELLGHGYFAESEGHLHDIFDLIRWDPSPSDRQRLTAARKDDGLNYWVMER
jgi:esterase/lipase superfamily enzyme